MRLVDADALKADYCDFCKAMTEELECKGDCMTCEIIDNQPTIEAEPVRHGRWAGNHRHLACSSCSMTFCVPDGVDGELDMSSHRYCPWCGAKMDLKEGAENA